MISFDAIRQRFPDRSAAYPCDWPKPTAEELAKIEEDFGVRYSELFREFQLRECHSTPIGDVAFDYFGWAQPTLRPMENLRKIVEEAQSYGVPKDLAPFRCDNADFFCITHNGSVVIWDHNSRAVEKDGRYQWSSFTEWLADGLEGR